MSHQEHFFLEYMPAVFTSPQSTVNPGFGFRIGFGIEIHVGVAKRFELKGRGAALPLKIFWAVCQLLGMSQVPKNNLLSPKFGHLLKDQEGCSLCKYTKVNKIGLFKTLWLVFRLFG